ncbi:amino acid ABC transporter permease [Gulosibacter sp. 10]|uniref:amino acid ABC transporter permease n=1 Tax=Gulosibacter sp. 10 TaxID=1255570 RepID=UPI00097E99E3|nr:amino acid ABC transporter permease [Gulosibacter sp. 10]SJM59546.1 ABC amino acid transporter, permease component [Gulosibacter sp. 10]
MSAQGSAAQKEGADLVIVPRRHVGRRIVSVLVLVAVALMVVSMATNERFQWDVIVHYFTSWSVLAGLWNTVLLTVLSMLIAIVLGVIAALMRQSSSWVLRGVSAAYLWVFRGTPLLVQVILLFNISALYPTIAFGIPFTPLQMAPIDVNALITPFMVGVIALGVNEGAYMAEIIRGGILSVPAGQVQAAQALGMTPARIFRRIVLPQAIRTILPPTGNQVISMLKATSLVSVIAFPDLLYSVQAVYSRTFETIPLLLVATIWYLIITTILMIGQHFIERHYDRSDRSQRRRRPIRVGNEGTA